MIIDDVIVGLDKIGKDLGFEVDVDFDWLDKGKIATITFKDGNNVFLTVAIAYWRIENIINIYDKKGKNLYTEKVPGTKDDISLYDNLMKETKQILEKEEQQLLNTPEKIYDYGEEHNWQGLEQKHFETLSKDKNLAQMAVADMQDKEIVIPEILKKFRRYSMSFKDVVFSKIAKNKKVEQKINRVATVNKKATEEDIKLKVQKNKPSGLDTSAPQVLEGKAKKVFEDMMTAYSNVQEVKADIEKFKAKTDKLIQKKIQKVGLDEKTAKLQELVNKSAKLVSSIENTTFQNADKLGVFVNKTQVVPKKFSDKEKIAKLMEYIDKELGKGRAEQYLKNAENGLQSQATEKAIKELVVFEPIKQQKTSDTHDEESNIDTLIDTMKEVYTNLRNYYLSMVKTNNVIEEQLLPTVTASKKQLVTKKANWFDLEDPKNLTYFNLNNIIRYYQTIIADMKEIDAEKMKNAAQELVKALEKFKSYSDYEEKEEDTEIESKKKIKVVKKAKMHKKAADNKVRIFLTNLGKYNEGELVGEWVDLPVQDFKPILDKIGIDGKNYEEVFITDYEAPFEISEYENINALNEKVKKIEALDEEQKDILYSLADEWDFDELYEKVVNGDYHYIPQGSITNAIGEKEASNIDLAYGYIDQLGGFETLAPKTIEDYFDYDSYGETLSYDFQTTNKGYVEIY